MIAVIKNNTIKTNLLEMKADGIIGESVCLRGVSVSFKTDDSGKRTTAVDVVRYDCFDPDNFSNFVVKVSGKPPVISEKEVEESADTIYIQIPVSETVIKPYEIAYGVAKVSIVAPYVTLVSD